MSKHFTKSETLRRLRRSAAHLRAVNHLPANSKVEIGLRTVDRVQVKDHVDGFGGDTGTVVRVGRECALVGGLTIQLDRRRGRLSRFHSFEVRSEG